MTRLERLRRFWSRYGLLVQVVLLGWLVVSVLFPLAASVASQSARHLRFDAILTGLVVCLAAFTIAGARWSIVARAFGYVLPYGPAVRLNFIGYFYFCVTPFGIGMDLLKVVRSMACVDDLSAPVATAIVLVDRLIGLIGIVIAFVAVVSVFHHARLLRPLLELSAVMLPFVGLGIAAVAVLAAVVFRRTLAGIDWTVIARARLWPLALATLMSMLSQAVLVSGLLLLLAGFERHMPAPDVAAASLGGMLFTAIPATVFGVGAPQVANVAVLLALGWAERDAALLTFLAHGATAAGGLLGGLLAIAGTARAGRSRVNDV